ncbi:putative multidrug resistance protein efflux transporter [Ketogulonicigenium robustum]|uniref:Multidrug-efflux transporter n=1 Tax=Ketogulonicigenium robustum TaxID=92947 RepID=A0A1W6NYI1_9RHOB|nr:MATE family efflux transporter [Ketogulonicigenium robustum]ARO14305.1 putative multidrug resistance protein efflux transporter [Ketogulonicigenium robustum]
MDTAQKQRFTSEIWGMLALGVPLIASNLAQMIVNLTDTVLLGWYDVKALAAVTLAHALYTLLYLFGAGFAWAVMPLVAEAGVQGDETRVRRVTRMGIWLTLGFGALALVPMMASGYLLRAIGQDPAMADMAHSYLRIVAFGLIFSLLVACLRSFLAALSHTAIVFWTTVIVASVNAVLVYGLIFGNFGLPALGMVGAAVGTTIAQAVGLLVLSVYAARKLPRYHLFQRFWRPDFGAIREVLRIGLPIGLTNLAEGGLFSATAVLVGWIGTGQLAAHGIAMQISGMVFMLYMGLSQAATILAGRAYGQRDAAALRRVSQAAGIVTMGVLVIGVAVFVLFRGPMVGAFISMDDPNRAEVLRIGMALLLMSALFQALDAMQVMALGLLRAVQDTTVPMLMAIFGYWCVGFPTSLVIGIWLGGGEVGVWVGLVAGLFVASVLMLSRYLRGLARHTYIPA